MKFRTLKESENPEVIEALAEEPEKGYDENGKLIWLRYPKLGDLIQKDIGKFMKSCKKHGVKC